MVLLDVVLGYGSHPDPVATLAPACADVAGPDGPRVVVYLLGTEGDPQGLDRQRAVLAAAGAIVRRPARRPRFAAAAIACRNPTIVDSPLP